MPRINNTIEHNGKRLVCRIFDNGGETADRYTIALQSFFCFEDKGVVYPYLAISENPFHPQGCGARGESREFLTGKHLGKRVAFDSLPVDVQTFILKNI